MNQFEKQLNELLVDTFRTILKVEEKIIRSSNEINLSISELHLLEAVGDKEHPNKTISELSATLGISLPSVTIAVNKLVKKEFLKKEKSPTDGRSVTICLTKSGDRMNRLHNYFHKKMVTEVSKEMTEEEKEAMMRGIQKLNSFFKEKSDMMED
ncbi:MAG: MarR family transcriptional regulator [Oscillospiraceae bacterium]